MSDPAQPRLLLGLKPIAERQIRDALFAATRMVAVVGSAAEAGELCALAGRRPADTVLVSPALSGLAGSHCAQLRTQGLRVLGLALDDRDAAVLDALGVDMVVQPPLTPAELANACRNGRTDATAERIAADASEPPPARALQLDRRRAGSVLAVVAAERSPGASECALSLAACGDRRWPTVLVECDLHRGGLALRLGADPQQGSLLGLVRATMDADNDALAGLLERWTVGGEEGWPPVLLAPPDLNSHIDELSRPGAVRAAVEAAASVYPLVVADVGGLLATAGEVPKVARCHREALLTADSVLLVIGAREDQLQAGRAQLAALLDELEIKPERVRICVTGLGGPGAVSQSDAEEILAEEIGALHLVVDGWLPYDRRAATRAARTGLPLAAARPHGPYARALRKLLDVLFVPGQPITRERKHRLHIAVSGRGDDATDRRRARARAEPHQPDEPGEEVPLPWRS